MKNDSTWHTYHTVWLLTVVILFSSGIFFLLQTDHAKRNATSNSYTRAPTVTKKPTTSMDGKQFFVTHIPNLNNLTLKDLPDYSGYIKEMYPYKNRLIISGSGLVMDYDPSKHEMIRMSPWKCGDATVIKEDLYVMCLDESEEREVYKVNLATGIMKTTHITSKDTNKAFINPTMTGHNETLWGETWDWIFKLDTKTNKIQYYETVDLPFNCKNEPYENCHAPDDIYVENGTVKVIEYNTESILAYDYKTDNWNLTDEKGDLLHRQRKSSNEWDINIPDYLSLSPIIDNKRYLFSDTGMYILSNNDLPKFMYKLNIPTLYYYFRPMYIDSKQNQILLVCHSYQGIGGAYKGSTVADNFCIYLIDIKTGKTIDLLKKSYHGNGDTKTYYPFLSSLGLEAEYSEENDQITAVNKKTHRVSFKVDLKKQSITYINLTVDPQK